MIAGMSSRFGGKIKQFARVGPNGESLIEYSIKQAINAGFDKIIFIVGEKTEEPFKYMFGDDWKGIPILYAKQTFDKETRDKPWGTCDAILAAKDLIDDDFVVCNGDDLYGENTFKSLIEFAKTNETDCATIGYMLGNVLPLTGTVNRGIISIDDDQYLTQINETLNISRDTLEENELSENNLSSQNIFLLKPQTLDLLETKLINFKKTHPDDRTSECYLPVELSELIYSNKIKIKLLYTQDKWFGVTNPEDEEIIRNQLKELK